VPLKEGAIMCPDTVKELKYGTISYAGSCQCRLLSTNGLYRCQMVFDLISKLMKQSVPDRLQV
jgi:hypothetical protein